MKPAPSHVAAVERWAVTVRGVIQGVGFRPFVYNAARAEGLTGWVRNETDRVRIEAEGEPRRLDRFVDRIRHAAPPQARVESVKVEPLAPGSGAEPAFVILESQAGDAPQPAIPADLATCPDCLAELLDPRERRHRYPFTNCTNCGPRWSIIERLPYDRPRTAMRDFALCRACQAEYHEPADRRFHAQPIACPVCGPTLELLAADGVPLARGDEALGQAVAALCAGRILALKALGGFQLLVDATSAEAVQRLRSRKRRPDKPFALLLASLEEVRRHCELSQAEARELASAAAPILLLPRRAGGALADAVAPGNPYLGVMLSATPLHHLLIRGVDRPLVCTSGNLAEEPMATSTAEALARLGKIADLVLTHDRPIVRPVDDSVARLTRAGPQILRRARGYAPLPIALADDGPAVLALGPHLKNTVGLALGRRAILGAHVGDLDNVLSVAVHRRAAADLLDFFAVRPDVIACDLHPDYASTQYAEELAASLGAPLVRVQHHHAHVAACMAEHHLDGPVLGLAWDGVGYGTDGTAWGSEALRCEGGGFTRVAHLRPFRLPGGDRAAREPRRSALGLLFAAIGGERTARDARNWFTQAELAPLLVCLERGLHAPWTSGMGRLFDAVAALCGLPATVSFEGQAAMSLEFAADPEETAAYPLPLTARDAGPAMADWSPLVEALRADRAAGLAVGRISARFHNALAALAVDMACQGDCPRVVLSGGCFQNGLLADGVGRRLRAAGFEVYTHRQVPPGDGGLALGQLWVARQLLQE